MPTPTIYASAKEFLGIAKETTMGTPVAPTVWLPFDEFSPEDKPNNIGDEALRGSMVEVYGNIQGTLRGEFTLKGPWFGDQCCFLLANILGDLTTTGGGAPFTHAFSTLNSGQGQPGTLTLTDQQAQATNSARQWAGVCLSELTIKGSTESELVTYEAKGVSWPSVAAAAPQTSSFTAVAPIAAWRVVLGIAGPASGGTQVKTVGDWEFTIKRALQMIYTAQNSQNPYIIARGKVGAEGKLTFTAAADETPLTYLLNNTQPQLQALVSNGAGGGNLVTLQFDCQNAAWQTSAIKRDKEAVAFDTTFRAIANTTNAGASGGYSPIKVTAQNATAAGVFV